MAVFFLGTTFIVGDMKNDHHCGVSDFLSSWRKQKYFSSISTSHSSGAAGEEELCFDFLPYFETQNFVEGNSSFRRGNIGLVQGNKPLVSPLLPCCPAQRCTRSRNGRSRCRKCKFRRETPWIKPQPRLCNELKKIIICLYYPITYYPITYYHITYYPQGIFLCTISAISQ